MGEIRELHSLGEVRGQLFGVRLIAFSNDGNHVATADVGMELALWHDGQVVLRWDMSEDGRKTKLGSRVRAASFSGDGRSLYVASADVLWCLDTVSGGVRWKHRGRPILAFLKNACFAAAALPDERVLSTYDDGKFEIRTGEGALVARWGHRDCPRHLNVVDEGRRVVGADGFAVGVWDLETREQIARFIPGGHIVGLSAAQAGGLTAIRTLDEYVLWDRLSRTELLRVPSEVGLPCVDVCSAGALVAFASLEGVTVWRPDGRPAARAGVKGVRVLSVKFSPDCSTLAAGCMDGSVRLWNVRSVLHR